MEITLEKAAPKDARALHDLQIKSFSPLLKRYKDYETNPACEPIDKTLSRITEPPRSFYKILKDGVLVGGLAIKQTSSDTLFLGPIFIDPAFQNQKMAQKALQLIESLFPAIEFFELAAISQEKGAAHLYEKMGYIATGETKNDNSLIIFFRKQRSG